MPDYFDDFDDTNGLCIISSGADFNNYQIGVTLARIPNEIAHKDILTPWDLAFVHGLDKERSVNLGSNNDGIDEYDRFLSYCNMMFDTVTFTHDDYKGRYFDEKITYLKYNIHLDKQKIASILLRL